MAGFLRMARSFVRGEAVITAALELCPGANGGRRFHISHGLVAALVSAHAAHNRLRKVDDHVQFIDVLQPDDGLARQHLFEQSPKEIAVPEPTVPVLGEGSLIAEVSTGVGVVSTGHCFLRGRLVSPHNGFRG